MASSYVCICCVGGAYEAIGDCVVAEGADVVVFADVSGAGASFVFVSAAGGSSSLVSFKSVSSLP